MLRYFVAFSLACATLGSPAAAQGGGEWRHEGSGISLPRQIGEMRLGNVRDASDGGNYDVIAQLGSGATPVTLYVYRSAYPNAALWFERTRLAMNANVGSDERRAEPSAITIGGASAPNGLREDIALSGAPLRATSVAIIQAGQWLVKARISSSELDLPAVSARMDQLLGALRFASMPAPHPLRVPQPCSDSNRMSGEPVTEMNEEILASALPSLIMSEAAARGSGGLAVDPSAWCRDATQVPLQYGTVYRARDGGAWVTLLADSGRAVSAMRTDLPELEQTGRAALLANMPGGTSLIALFSDLPHPDRGTPAGIPVAAGAAQGMMSVGFGGPGESRGKN